MSEIINTVDALVVIDRKSIVLIRRAKPPFMDKLVLPGGHVDPGEEFRDACVRELKEEIMLDVLPERVRPIMMLADPSRDPRPGHRISHVFWVHITEQEAEMLRAQSDARELVVRPILSLHPEEIGFDHWKAIGHVI